MMADISLCSLRVSNCGGSCVIWKKKGGVVVDKKKVMVAVGDPAELTK